MMKAPPPQTTHFKSCNIKVKSKCSKFTTELRNPVNHSTAVYGFLAMVGHNGVHEEAEKKSRRPPSALIGCLQCDTC